MNRLVVIVGLVLVVSSAVFGETSQVSRSQSPEAEQQIRALVREWDAAYEERDTVTLNRILADAFVLTDASGAVLNRAQYLMSVIKSPEFSGVQSFMSEDVKVTINGEKAKVTGRSKVKGRPRGRGQVFEGHYRFTDTLIKLDGRWQFVASHSTPIITDGRTGSTGHDDRARSMRR